MAAMDGMSDRVTTRLIRSCALAFATAFLLSLTAASAAQAGVVLDPSIRGAGRLDAPLDPTTSYACQQTTENNDAILNCPQLNFTAPGFDPTIVVLTATPRAGGGWTFTGWSRCPQPNGNQCTFSAGPFQTVRGRPEATFVDVTPPVVSGLSHSFLAQNRTLRFTWGLNEMPGLQQCQMDSGPVESCASGKIYTLSEGPHTFRVRARDRAGNTSAFATRSVLVLDTPPVSVPRQFERVRSAIFRYRSQVGTSFECLLDTPAPGTPGFADCGPKAPDGTGTKSYTATDLAQDGQYTFRVRSRLGADVDATPLVHTWTVDTVAPNTTLSTTLPEGVLTTLLDATFSFGSTEPLGTLQCRLDSAAFTSCASPRTFTNLPFGSRRFEARAVDRAGNVDATPATRNWTIAAKDDDNDGFNQRSDCNDSNAGINPARPEILDNDVDENCDGVKGINLDRDGDGVQRPLDCDDGNPAIAPGAADIPNNNVDEDCSGADFKQLERIVASLARSFKAFTRFTKLTRLQLKNVPAGSMVRVTCKLKKRKCPGKARKAVTRRNVSGTVALRQFTKVRLRVGTTITVTISKRNAIGAVKILTIRRAKEPVVRDRCLPPGAKRPTAC
jgi:hypothetical protein